MTDSDFHHIFEEHKDSVYRFAWRMTNSPSAAEDIAQDVFLELLRQPARFDPGRGAVRTFLFAIARNLALKRWRDEHRWADLDDDRITEPVHLEHAEIAEIVAGAVRSLPPLQGEVLILAEYEELSLEEIARAVESEIGTVKSRLHRARENLRRMLAPVKMMNARTGNHGTVR